MVQDDLTFQYRLKGFWEQITKNQLPERLRGKLLSRHRRWKPTEDPALSPDVSLHEQAHLIRVSHDRIVRLMLDDWSLSIQRRNDRQIMHKTSLLRIPICFVIFPLVRGKACTHVLHVRLMHRSSIVPNMTNLIYSTCMFKDLNQ